MPRMHADHVKHASNNRSYHKAQQIALQIKEKAKLEKVNTKGLKVLTKLEVIKQNLGHADAMIVWKKGPENWAHAVEFADPFLDNVSISVDDGYTISLYDT